MIDHIKVLSKDLKPFKVIDSFKLYFTKWLMLSLVLVTLTFLLLPLRNDFFPVALQPHYIIENILWMILSITSARALYVNSFPERSIKNYLLFIAFIFSLLIFMMINVHDFSLKSMSILQEMDFWRGRCGFLILAISAIHIAYLFNWAKPGAPSSPAVSGMMIGLSASSLGCLLMQFICPHQTSFHLFVWHFLPLMAISSTASIIAKKSMRW